MKKSYLIFCLIILGILLAKPGLTQFSVGDSFNNVPVDANIEIPFSSAINTPSTANVKIHGSFSGRIAATFSGGGTNTLTIDPTQNLSPGEIIKIYITAGLGVGVRNYELVTASAAAPHDPAFFKYKFSSSNPQNTTRRVAVGDLNGDDLSDVLTPVNNGGLNAEAEFMWLSGADNYSLQNNVIFGDGVASFETSAIINDLDLADLDLDGDLDVLAAVLYPSDVDQVYWLRNNGNVNPAFTAIKVSTNLDNVTAIDFADVDGDGFLDVVGVAPQTTTSNVQWFKNNNNTSFIAQSSFVANDLLSDIKSIDVDQDGDIDFVGAGIFFGKVYLYENDGSQNFTERILSDEAGGVQEIRVADMDDDRDYDIISAATGFNALEWHMNDGSNQNWPQTDIAFLSPSSIDIADMDGNGQLDMLTASNEKLKYSFFEQRGSDFNQFQLETSGADDLTTKRIIHADIDNDGDFDIVAINDSITFYESVQKPLEVISFEPDEFSNIARDFSFTIEFNQNLPSSIDSEAIKVRGDHTGFIQGSFDGLGTPTVSFTPSEPYQFGENVEVFVNSILQSEQSTNLDKNYSYRFTIESEPPPQEPISFKKIELLPEADFNGPKNVRVIDLDRDGDNDILAALFSSDKVALLRNDGNDNYSEEIIDAAAIEAVGVAASDLNKDGFTDVFSLSNSGLAWYDHNNSFAKTTIPVSLLPTDPQDPQSPRPSAIIVIDLNGDSFDDILVGFENFKEVIYLENSGTHTFPTEVFVNTGGFEANLQTSLSIGDVDLDGDIDIFSTIFGDTKELRWYENDGEENFTKNASFTKSVNRISNSAVADIDNDGDMDVVRVADTSPSVTYWRNDGGIFVVEVIVEPLRNGPENVEVNDINGDGFLDIITSSFSDDAVYVYFNDALGDFERVVVNDGLNGINSVTVADIEMDGDLDILSTELIGDKISIHSNIATLTEVISFQFLESVGESVIDSEDNSITSIVSSGTSLSTLIPEFVLSEEAAAFVNDSIVESAVSTVDFSSQVDFIVKAEDQSIETDWIVNVNALPNAPVIDTIIASQTSFQINWTPVPDAVDYILDLEEPGNIAVFEGATFGGSTWFFNGTLKPGFQYNAFLRSRNSVGVSSNVGTYTFTTIPPDPIAYPATGISESSYFVNWANVSGASGYKIQVSLLENFSDIRRDTTVSGGATKQVEISGLQFGTQYFYRVISFNDYGESGPSNIVNVQTNSLPVQILDVQFPDILDFDDENAPLEFRVSGGPADREVRINRRKISETDKIFEKVADTIPDRFSFVFERAMLDEIGVEFFIEVVDPSSVAPFTSGPHYIVIGEAENEEAIPVEKIGGTVSDWQIISVPYKLNDIQINSVFKALSTFRYKFDWRLLHYRNQVLADAGEGFNTIDLGRSYWFNTKVDVPLTLGSRQTNGEVPFELILLQGWNQIGNPYNISISWDKVLEANGIDSERSRLRVYNPNTLNFEIGDRLDPFQGGYVFSDVLTSLDITPDQAKFEGTQSRTKKTVVGSNIDEPEWQVTFKVSNGETSIDLGAIGMHPKANSSIDAFDDLSIPRFLHYLDFQSYHPEYFYPWFNKDFVQTQDQYSWSFTLESNYLKEKTSINWSNSEFVDAQASLYLVDEFKGKIVDMKVVESYDLAIQGKRQFTFHFSKEPDFEVSPNYIVLGDPYPNPMINAVKVSFTLSELRSTYGLDISVHDIHGRRIATLADGQYSPGFYEIEWDRGNMDLESGIYLLRVTFDDLEIQPMQRKLIISK